MRKSKFATSCLYISLGTILFNVFAIILLKAASIQLETMTSIYVLIMSLAVATVIASIVSIVRIAVSKKQLKGMAKSIIAIVLSILGFTASAFQWVFVGAAISVRDYLNTEVVEIEENDANLIEEEEIVDSNTPRYVKKDFDVVAVADYYGELDKVGYIDKEGDFVIEPKFDAAKDFYEGLAPVKLDGKWGYIDKTGEFVIQPQFDKADIFSSGLAAVKVDGKWGFIDKTGEFILPPQWEEPTRFVEGLVPFVFEETGKIGFMDTTGEIVITPEYEYVHGYFSEGYTYVAKDMNNVFESGGLLDKEGNFLSLPSQTLGFGIFFSEGLLPYSKAGDELDGFIDNTGQYIIAPQFSKCGIFSEGLADVIFTDGDAGYIDKTGEVVIELNDYYFASPFSEGLALVARDVSAEKPWGYIDKTGNFVIEPQFTHAYSFSEGLALVNIEEKGWGFIDKTGEFVIGPVEYADFGRFHKIDGVFDPKKAEIDELEIK